MKRNLLIAAIAMAVGFSACEKKEALIDQVLDQEEIAFTDEIIPGSWIIVYNDNTNFKKMPIDAEGRNELVMEVSKDVFKRASVEFTQPTYVYGSAFRGLSMKLSDEDALLLKGDPDVRGVYPDIVIQGRWDVDPVDPPDQEVPYGVARTGWGNYTGSFKAFIIDTGIDLDHTDLNVDNSLGFLAPDIRSRVGFGDDNGHGTHCAGTVAGINNDIGVVGVAAGATVVAVKVLDKRGSGSATSVIAGIDYVIANSNPGDAANLSLSSGVYEPTDLAVIALGEAGVFVAMAAGNDEVDANLRSPARANGDNLYTVSAMDVNDNFASFSNWGNPPVDFCAPGVYTFSTYLNNGYATMSGTSMASPHVCGLLLLTNGNINTDGYVNGDPDGNPDPIAHN